MHVKVYTLVGAALVFLYTEFKDNPKCGLLYSRKAASWPILLGDGSQVASSFADVRSCSSRCFLHTPDKP